MIENFIDDPLTVAEAEYRRALADYHTAMHAHADALRRVVCATEVMRNAGSAHPDPLNHFALGDLLALHLGDQDRLERHIRSCPRNPP